MTLSLFPARPFQIQQSSEGYRYSIEPFLLAHFLALEPEDRTLDIGTGCGIIPLLIASRHPQARVTGVELQTSLATLASDNIERSGLRDRVTIINQDIADFAESAGSAKFEHIVSNPPYRKVNTGRLNPNSEKALARHELKLNLETLCALSETLLKKGGTLTVAYPPSRLTETLNAMTARELHPKRLWFIHGNSSAPAKIFLAQAVLGKKTECVVEPPLYVYESANQYTLSMERIYASFNHTGRPDRVRED
ncbi:MAG: tRNA1(Val) (adenine(37)-N6)-methyltransferase [Candidatus Nitrohelix vancouverensis]|uniref:tRNA1(Val) (Adenine(37)-N6)-methyltransferase n=1 Tax=Candidatus Nitrohelix vancouverensis TaxID=2705534 RepID=A0A7T0C2E6_9BACT|nr:MAG: tRNA1(Val) (adenine(37)-N6)-methyltransferase [Candidatus Nitrohelix vancouverensis]